MSRTTQFYTVSGKKTKLIDITTFKRIILLLLLLLLNSCALFLTPISKQKVEQLTTCNNSFSKIRKNLLLQGYTITHETSEDLSTDYLRDDFEVKGLLGNTIQSYDKKITLIKIDESTTRFVVKIRVTKYGTDSGIGGGQIRTGNLNQAINQKEILPQYLEENLSWHQKVKNEICSGSS